MFGFNFRWIFVESMKTIHLAVKIKFLRYLEADILTKTFLRQPFCKIQDGGHIALGTNGNIVFLIAYRIRLPKMYILILYTKIRRNYIYSVVNLTKSSNFVCLQAMSNGSLLIVPERGVARVT